MANKKQKNPVLCCYYPADNWWSCVVHISSLLLSACPSASAAVNFTIVTQLHQTVECGAVQCDAKYSQNYKMLDGPLWGVQSPKLLLLHWNYFLCELAGVHCLVMTVTMWVWLLYQDTSSQVLDLIGNSPNTEVPTSDNWQQDSIIIYISNTYQLCAPPPHRDSH